MALVPGIRPILDVGGRVFTDLTTLKMLVVYISANTQRSTARLATASSGYAVTAAKTLTLYAARTQQFQATGASGAGYLGYSDNDVGIDTTTAFTNPGYMAGGSSVVAQALIGYSVVGFTEFPLPGFQIPATKYVAISGGGATNALTMYLFGYET